MKILLDTNFIITLAKNKSRLFEEMKEEFGNYELIIPKQVIEELKKISIKKETKIIDRENAEVGLKIISKQKFISPDLATNNVDASIIEYSKDKELIIGTLDKKLKQKLKSSNSKTKFLFLKKGKLLEIASR